MAGAIAAHTTKKNTAQNSKTTAPRTARPSAVVEAYKPSNWHQHVADYTLRHSTKTCDPRRAPFSVPFWQEKKEPPAGQAILVPAGDNCKWQVVNGK